MSMQQNLSDFDNALDEAQTAFENMFTEFRNHLKGDCEEAVEREESTESLNDRITELEGEVSDLQEEVQDKENQIETLEQRIDELVGMYETS